MKKIIFALILIIILSGCKTGITGMVVKDDPNQCTSTNGKAMDILKAKDITRDSECETIGIVFEKGTCNYVTGTWWMDIVPRETKEGCNPACVVNIEKETAEINWRCTGLNSI